MSLKKKYTMSAELRYEFVNILRELAENWSDKN